MTTDEDILRLVILKSKFEFDYPNEQTPDGKYSDFGYVKEKDFDDALEIIKLIEKIEKDKEILETLKGN